jgi:hypothetical protein
LFKTFAVLCTQQRCSRVFGPHLARCLPEAERTVGDDELGCDGKPAPLQIEQQIAPVRRAFPGSVGEADELLLSFRGGTDQHQHALLLVLQARLQVDAVSPDVDVALGGEIAPGPGRVLVLRPPLSLGHTTGTHASSGGGVTH